MPFSKYIVIPVFFAVQAAVLLLIAPLINLGSPESIGGPSLIVWVTFHGWAMYFLAGASPKMIGKVLICFAGGAAVSVAIIQLTIALVGVVGGYWGAAIAVFIIAVPLISTERVPYIDFLPGWFVGAGTFFALHHMSGTHDAQGYMAIAFAELVGTAVGLGFGYVSATFKAAYSKRVAAQTADS